MASDVIQRDERVVGAAVVDEEYLVVETVERLERRPQRLVEEPDDFRLVVTWHYH